MVQFKGTGQYYAIKALKKQEVLSRDEIERCVLRLGVSQYPGAWRELRTAGLGCTGGSRRQLNAAGALKK